MLFTVTEICKPMKKLTPIVTSGKMFCCVEIKDTVPLKFKKICQYILALIFSIVSTVR